MNEDWEIYKYVLERKKIHKLQANKKKQKQQQKRWFHKDKTRQLLIDDLFSALTQ